MNDTGHVTLYASSWMYGREVKDSLPFFAGWNSYVYTYYDGSSFPLPWYQSTFFIGVGGEIVFWLLRSKRLYRDRYCI